MTLRNNLYRILSTDPGTGSFRIRLMPDCRIYKAHFPGKPITPGVCIIQIASELLDILMPGTRSLSTVANAKFLSIINPLETEEITFTFKKISEEDNGTLKVSAIVSDKDTVFTKLSLRYKKLLKNK